MKVSKLTEEEKIKQKKLFKKQSHLISRMLIVKLTIIAIIVIFVGIVALLSL